MRLRGGPLDGVDVDTPIGTVTGTFDVRYINDRIMGVARYRRKDGRYRHIVEAVDLSDYADDGWDCDDSPDEDWRWDWVDEDDVALDETMEKFAAIILVLISVGLLYLVFQVARWAVRIGTGG